MISMPAMIRRAASHSGVFICFISTVLVVRMHVRCVIVAHRFSIPLKGYALNYTPVGYICEVHRTRLWIGFRPRC
jgi:hypothetical protein